MIYAYMHRLTDSAFTERGAAAVDGAVHRLTHHFVWCLPEGLEGGNVEVRVSVGVRVRVGVRCVCGGGDVPGAVGVTGYG